jgi:adenylate kinase family enzyme
MNKILILGGPGSGKTYAAKIIAKYLNINSYSLDDIYWDNSSPKNVNVLRPEDF